MYAGHVTALADHGALLQRVTDAIHAERDHADPIARLG